MTTLRAPQNLDHVIQVGGPHNLVGTQPTSALQNTFQSPRDGTEAECLAKYRKWLAAAVRSGEPKVCGALRRTCRRVVELREIGVEPLLAYAGAGHAESALVVQNALEWLIRENLAPLGEAGK